MGGYGDQAQQLAVLIGQWEHGQACWNNLTSPRLVEALHIVKACDVVAAGQKTVNLGMDVAGTSVCIDCPSNSSRVQP